MAARPLPFLHAARRRHGRAFTVRFPPYGKVVYLADPDDVRSVFKGDPATFHTGEARAVLGIVLGTSSLLLLDEEAHLRERRLMLPSFHGDALARYEQVMTRITEEEVERWPLGRAFALRDRMQAITLEVILRVVVGVSDPARRDALREALRRLVDIHPTVLLMASWLRRDLGPGSPWRTFVRRREAADALLYDEIQARREAEEDPEAADVLSLLLQARDEDGEPMSDRELRDELVTLLLAGHETTATGLAWAFERLLRHPAVLERLVEEVDAGEDGYLDAVVKEVLRVRPVVAEVARYLTGPVTLAGHDLPAGTTVMSSLALVQHDPEHFPDPLAFRPERFEDGKVEPYTWIPFGGGTRRCLGASFAQMEMKAVLRAVLERVELAALDPAPERARIHHVTLVPHRGAEALVVRRRRGRPAPELSGSAAPSASASPAGRP